MSNRPLPNSASTGSGFVAILVVVLLLIPIAVLAAGTCAFIGMNIAVIGFGPESLASGAAVGATVGVLLVAAWAVLFVTRARASSEASRLHAEKLTGYFQDMQFRVIKADSPVFRLLWALGQKVPPPVFLGARGSFVYPFGVFVPMVLSAGVIVWWDRPNIPLWAVWLTALPFLIVVIAGSVYNIKATRSLARKLQLPPWDQYVPAAMTGIAESSNQGKPL
jgi:Family of unknown function (DUF6404)